MPCARCTASVQKHQRSANHHRYVFHAGEVAYTERKCYVGEPGVLHVQPCGLLRDRPSTFSASISPERSFDYSRPLQERKDSITQIPPQDAPSRTERQQLPIRQFSGVRPNEVVYWHHLLPGGERPEPVDPRTRPQRFIERSGR